jgi:hypothetical protein
VPWHGAWRDCRTQAAEVTVADLIAKLQGMPQDAVVVDGDYRLCDDVEVLEPNTVIDAPNGWVQYSAPVVCIS